MPLLSPNQPPSTRQRRINWAALLFFSLAGVALGLWDAHETASITSGYVADYAFAGAFFLGIFMCLSGLLLLIYWRTRWFGWGLVAAGILSYLFFWGGIAILTKFDRVAWRHDQEVRFGPDQKSSVVIYFRKQVTDQQIEDFNHSVLELPQVPQHEGRGYPDFVSEYLRLTPSQANGYDAVALTFFDKNRADKVNAYLETIRADSRVKKVFLDTAPDAIHIDSKHP